MIRAALMAAVVALALLGAGATLAATPIAGTLGIQLVPAPLHVDTGTRAVTVTNLSGGLALAVELTASPAGYAVEPASFTLADGASQEVAITAVDPERDGTLTARGVAVEASGAVTSAVVITTRFVHRTFLERLWQDNPGAVAIVALLAVMALGSIIALSVRRRARHDRGT